MIKDTVAVLAWSIMPVEMAHGWHMEPFRYIRYMSTVAQNWENLNTFKTSL